MFFRTSLPVRINEVPRLTLILRMSFLCFLTSLPVQVNEVPRLTLILRNHLYVS